MKYDIIYVVEQTAACYFYRCYTPGVALAKLGYKTYVYSPPLDHLAKDSKVFVFQRPGRLEAVETIKKVRAAGGLAIVEIDDDLWNIATNNPAYPGWNKTPALKQLEASMRAASLITITTRALAESVSKLNPNVIILPNCLDDDIWQAVPRTRETDTLVVGWAGSPTHSSDLIILKGVIETLADRYPHVEFHFAGIQEPPFSMKERDNIKVISGVPLKEYPRLIANFDIGLAPVVDTKFNRAKSDLKFLEYSAINAPSVVSDIVTYETCEHGVTGFRAKSPKDWIKFISRLIENEDLRKEMAKNARTFAETRFISKNVHLWEEAYGLSHKEKTI